jgi:uncharacterized protein
MRILILMLLALGASGADKIRVQVTTGGHHHDISFYSLFEGQDDLAVDVDAHPSALRRELRNRVDVLVLFDLNDVNDEAQRKNLRDFLEGGGGLVVLHHALADNWQWTWWYEDVVGGRFLMGDEGGRKGSKAHAPVTLDVKPVAKHPVLEGVGAMTLQDEGYKGMWLSPKSTPLLETGSQENDRVVAWIGPWQRSRVVAIQLGHGPETHRSPAYRRLVRNAILWTAQK